MKTTLFLCLIAATAVLAEEYYPETPLAARARRKPKVVGGVEAEPHSVPYQVGLFLNGSFCGGSLITKRYVLTAAHCGVVTKHPVVVLGAHKIREKEPDQVHMNAKKVVNHKRYSGFTLDNDIAVIELPEDAPLSDFVKLVKVIGPNAGSLVGMTARVSGWGLDSDEAQSISPVLRVVKSTLMSHPDCSQKFGFRIPKNVVCMDGSKGKSACNGDSGGPLVLEHENGDVQVGVVSFGSSAGCEKGFPSAYTRLSSYLNWLRANSDYKF